MNNKKALITGITGQIGWYLSELLLSKGYEVHGIARKKGKNDIFVLHQGEISDRSFMQQVLTAVRPDEVYNLAAQSNSRISWDIPEETYRINAQAVIQMLSTLREQLPQTKFFQAGSAELFGGIGKQPYTEKTSFNPRNPYAVAKLAAFQEVKNWRERTGNFFVNGILFNAESARRGQDFVTTKIAKAAAQRARGSLEILSLGNISAERDWTHAADTAHAIYLTMQASAPRDYVIASGRKNTVRDFVTLAYAEAGTTLCWKGEGKTEEGYDLKNGNVLVNVNPHFFRPVELERLQGDPKKIQTELGWKPIHSLQDIVKEMVQSERAKLH